MPLVMPEDYTDDKEQVGADPAETAQRRAAMRNSSLRGGGEGDGTPQGKLRSVPNDQVLPGGPSADAAASARAGGESGSGNEPGSKSDAGQAFAGSRSKKALDRLILVAKGLAGSKKAIIGLATSGGIMGLIVALLVFYAQFKLVHIMEDLEQHFGARNNHAVQTRVSMYMREYFSDHLNGDGVRVINDATASFSTQIMHALWQGGMDARLEAGGYGKGSISVRPDYVHPGEKIIRIKDPKTGKITAYSTNDPTQSSQLREYTQNVMEPLVTSADDAAGKAIWFKYSLYTRLGVGSIFDPLYNLSNKIDTAKAEFVQGTLEQIYSIPGVGNVFDSIIDALLGSTPEGQTLAQQLKDSLSGQVDAKVTTTLATTDGLSKILSSTVGKFLANAAGDPFGLAALGLDLGCHAFTTLTSGQIPLEIQKATELTQVGFFQRYASAADEIKQGNVTSAEVSAVSSTLTSTDSSGQIHDVSESNNFARVNGQAIPYTPNVHCADYSELCVQKQASQRVKSTVVGQSLSDVASVSKNPLVQIVVAPLSGACEAFTTVVDALYNLVGAALQAVLNPLGLGSITTDIGGFIGGLFDKALGSLIVPVVDKTTAGPDAYNELAGGASNAYNIAAGSPAGTDQTQAAQSSSPDTCQAGETGNNGNPSDQSLCGHALTVRQAAQIDDDIESQQIAQFQNSSLVTKVASLNTPYSLASRLLDAGPSTPQEAVNEAGGAMVAMINPRTWVKFFADLPNLFVPKLAAASGQPGATSSYVVMDNGQGYAMDQVGVTQYGFTDQELDNTDLDNDGKLHNLDVAAGCQLLADVASTAPASTTIDVPQQCQQFLQTSPSSAGGAAPAPTGSGGPTTPSGSVQSLAQQVLSNKNITFTTSAAQQDVQDAANGQPSPVPCTGGSVMLKAALLQVMLEEAQKFQIGVGYITNGCHAANSYHYSGAAFDTDTINGTATVGRDQNAVDLLNYILPQLPSGSGIGQQGCGPEPDPSLPSGVIQFADTCNHLHIQVPR